MCPGVYIYIYILTYSFIHTLICKNKVVCAPVCLHWQPWIRSVLMLLVLLLLLLIILIVIICIYIYIYIDIERERKREIDRYV